MPGYKYLIIGGGMSAAAAIKGIREVDADGSIGLIGDEAHPPYKRPPLSKKLWQGKPLESVWKGISADGADMHLGHAVQSIRPGDRCVVDDAGTSYTFEKLLIATGGTPKKLPFGDGKIIYFRTVDDYKRLQTLTEQGSNFAVIGGGFIGSEISAALATNGKRVTLITPSNGIGDRIYPPDMVEYLNVYYRDKGVKLWTGDRATGLDTDNGSGRLNLSTRNGAAIAVDGLVAGIGIAPNTELARDAGLDVRDGIVVDDFLRTSHPDIYAAGDVATFFDHTLQSWRRVEHEDNAKTMGRMAGRAMAGEPEPYHHLPYFYSDLFDLGYEAVGELDATMQTVADWKEPYREGVVYYLREGRVRGVLLWNVWDQVDPARRLIAEPGPFRPEDLIGRLPEPAERKN